MIDTGTFTDKKALFHTFGCKLNFAETSTIAKLLADKGIRRVSTNETPDIIVVNTCSVTELADKKCRHTIRSFARRFPEADIIVTGCYAQLKSDEVASLPGVKIVAGSNEKLRITDFLEKWFIEHTPILDVTPRNDLRQFVPSCSRGDRTRYFLKVQDGCDYWCTYCTIPMARGRSRSGSISDIVRQAEQAAHDGGREIVITGVNIGDFGKGTDKNFLDLIRALDRVDGIQRYRISSIEPNLLTPEIIDFTASSSKFMPHFHVPLQSGSDTVLSLMHRHYDTAYFASKMEMIRKAIPDAFIGVDLIVGARGETSEEFEKSKQFIETLPISRLHVFTYSERPGTKALDITHKVSQEEKHNRTRRMLQISETKLEDFYRKYLGSIRPVLVEHSNTDGKLNGFTDNYIKVEMDGPASLDNTIVNVKLGEILPDKEVIKATIVR